jgi:hypothetical protein
MKKAYLIPFLFFCMGLYGCFAQADSVLISDVKFQNSKFNNPHAGSGFLLSFGKKVYGITAKHVLSFAKTDSMKTISFGNSLKSWNFTSKKTLNRSVLAGKLINENLNERIEMPPKGDWLIFETTGNIPEGIVVYSLRDEPLKAGDNVHFLGYPYNSMQPVNIKGTFIGLTKDNNLKLVVPKGAYGGCSGGPVIDTEGKLVGIVSMGYFNEKENQMIFESASLEYFKNVINH